MNGKRLRSLDALRGFDMFWIMGLSGAVAGFCKLFPGGENSFLFHQMYHVEWEGLAFHDTIFPLFLFIAGASFPFSYASQVTKGASRLTIHLRILKRFVLLAVLGLVLVPTCPIVKKLWTPTFTLVCAGESFLLFALFHWIIDVKGLVKWSFPFQVVGANAIIAYMMQSLVNFRDPSRFLFGALAKLFPSPDFVIMSGYTLICWLILWYLYRKGTFLKV